MWSLHFLLLVVVIDIANEEISLYLCLILSMFFLVFVMRDVWADRKNERKSKATWDIARRKQASGVLAQENEEGDRRQQVEQARLAVVRAQPALALSDTIRAAPGDRVEVWRVCRRSRRGRRGGRKRSPGEAGLRNGANDHVRLCGAGGVISKLFSNAHRVIHSAPVFNTVVTLM